MYKIRLDDPKEVLAIRKKASRFQYNREMQTLYHATRDRVLLKCLSPQEAQKVVKEAHDGMRRAHKSGPKLGDQIRRLGYYWRKNERCHQLCKQVTRVSNPRRLQTSASETPRFPNALGPLKCGDWTS